MAAKTTASGGPAADLRREPARPDDVRAVPVPARPERSAGYRTFAAKVPLGLGAAGGALLVAGGLGLHLRATRTFAEGQAPEEVFRAFGASGRPGWLIAIAGVVAATAALAWRARPMTWKLAPIGAAILGIALAVWRLRFLDDRAAAIVASEPPSPDFFSFHAGFGWGAWLLLMGAILLTLSAISGVLREADVRLGLGT